MAKRSSAKSSTAGKSKTKPKASTSRSHPPRGAVSTSPVAAKAAIVRATAQDDPAAVNALVESMDPARRSLVTALRAAILEADSAVTEGVKWNSPSFYANGWFATLNTRGKGVLVVLHQGAARRADSHMRDEIADENGLLHWHGHDRASLAFATLREFTRQRAALIAIVRAWVRHLRTLAPSR